MKTKSVHALLLLCAFISFISCRKESAPVKDNEQLLTEESWGYDQYGIDQDLDGDIDIPTNLDACQLDDMVKFNPGGSGTLHQGSNKCYPDFPDEQSFEWALQNGDTQIEYGGALHNILTLDENRLAIYTEEFNGSSTVRHILIYKH